MKIAADLAGKRNLSNQDTLGTEESALISGDVLYTNRVYIWRRYMRPNQGVLISGCPNQGVLISGCPNQGVLISECPNQGVLIKVSSFQGVLIKVS